MAADDHHPPPPPPPPPRRQSLIYELVRTPEYSFFHCRRCSCWLSQPEYFYDRVGISGLFVALINYRETDEERVEIVHNIRFTSVAVYCLQCNNRIGLKVINIRVPGKPENRRPVIWLNMSRLMYWNGHESVEASSTYPPERTIEQAIDEVEQFYHQFYPHLC